MSDEFERRLLLGAKLCTQLNWSGAQLIQTSGYLRALRDISPGFSFDGDDARAAIESARDAIAEASAEIDAYEADTKLEMAADIAHC